jgi:hypothetical protein
VRVVFLIAVSVVLTMGGNPFDDIAFAGKTADRGEEVTHGLPGLEAAVREQAVEAERHADATGHPVHEQHEGETFPREVERCRDATKVEPDDPDDRGPIHGSAFFVFTLGGGGIDLAGLLAIAEERFQQGVFVVVVVFMMFRRFVRGDVRFGLFVSLLLLVLLRAAGFELIGPGANRHCRTFVIRGRAELFLLRGS